MKKISVVLLLSLLLISFSVNLFCQATQEEKKDISLGLQLPNDITSDQAHKITAEAVKKAKELNTLMNIAVVDAGGNLKIFYRMDGSFLGSIDISVKKAVTARFFNMSSEELGKAAQPGEELFGIEATNGGLAIFGGGELIKDKDGNIIGAIGVSGSSVANDIAVAQAGAQALNEKK